MAYSETVLLVSDASLYLCYMIRDIFFDYIQFETGTKRSRALKHGYHGTLGLDARTVVGGMA